MPNIFCHETPGWLDIPPKDPGCLIFIRKDETSNDNRWQLLFSKLPEGVAILAHIKSFRGIQGVSVLKNVKSSDTSLLNIEVLNQNEGSHWLVSSCQTGWKVWKTCNCSVTICLGWRVYSALNIGIIHRPKGTELLYHVQAESRILVKSNQRTGQEHSKQIIELCKAYWHQS